MIAEKLKNRLRKSKEGWNITVVSGPTGVGKTYLVSSVLREMGYIPVFVNLASRENPIKSIVAALEAYFSDDTVEDSGMMSSVSLKSLLTQNYLAEDVLLGLLAQYLDIILGDNDKIVIVFDDVQEAYISFIDKFLLKLRNVSTDRPRRIVVIVRNDRWLNIPSDYVVYVKEVDPTLFMDKFNDEGMFLWELTGGSLGLANFVYESGGRIDIRQTLEGMFFDIFNNLAKDLQKLLKKLAIWALGYEGYLSMEIYDLLSLNEQQKLHVLEQDGILESFGHGGFRFVSTHFMHYIVNQMTEKEKEEIVCLLVSMVIDKQKVFLTRRTYMNLEKLGKHRKSRYVLIRSLRSVRFYLSEYEYEMLGVKEHFLTREDVPIVEKMYLVSFLWWIEIYDPLLLEIYNKYFSYLIKRSYLLRFYTMLRTLFLQDKESKRKMLPLSSSESPVNRFIDMLQNALNGAYWDKNIDRLFNSIRDVLHPVWHFIYLYIKYTVSKDTAKGFLLARRSYEISSELGSPLLIVAATNALLDSTPLSEFPLRVDVLVKAYKVAPPSSYLFEVLVSSMLENLREISSREVIDEFIEFSHMDFRSEEKKIWFLAKVAFHYMVAGNLPKAKMYINLIENLAYEPVITTYLKALYSILMGDRSLFNLLLKDLYQWIDKDSEYLVALEDMANVWLGGGTPSRAFRNLRNETNIVLWYLSFWTYAFYYVNRDTDDKQKLAEGLEFFDDVIESLMNAGMEFSKNVAYIYKGKLLYKKGDILRSREFIKSAYMFFLKTEYEEHASSLEGILSYIRPDIYMKDPSAKDIFMQWSSYYRRVDSVASLYESLIDMLLYISDADNVDLFLDRLISEMLYVLVAEKLFVFACKEGEIRYFKSYGLGSSGTAFSKTARDIIKEGSRVSKIPSYLQVVYHGDDYTIGLFAESSVAGAFDYIHLDMSKRVLRIVESVLVGNEMRRLAIYDSLTGLYTRWYFSIRFNEEFRRSFQEGRPLAILYMDIDDFKRINDRYGHLEGDEVLRRVGNVIRGNVRTVDIPARYGGEEMVVMLLGSTKEEAVLVAERLRHKIAEAFPDKPYTVTVSVGIASIPEMKASTPDELIEMADKAMYHAKRTGKNKVVVYSEELLSG